MTKKQSEGKRKWWASLSQAEKDAINQKRSEARRRFWAGLTDEQREELKKTMRVNKGKKNV